MKETEDFVIDHPYELTGEDLNAIEEASPDEMDKDDWEKISLNDFKICFQSKNIGVHIAGWNCMPTR